MPGPVAFDAMRPAVGSLRLVRSLVIALLCTATAAIAHLSAGGIVPGFAVVTLFLGAGAVSWVVSSRRVTTGQMVGLLVLCQICVHLGCSMGSMNMSALMATTHIAATAVSALALARGEAFVWRVAARLGLRLRPHVLGFVPVPSRVELVPVTVTRSRHDVRLAHSRALRGPPYGCS
ncbi:hypothetical protein J2X11_001707 [Aeromicrobium panaciterrae]|uniref:MFS transporter n=1 Tax=Aeromicrobium panaciterrae TaxID=363861 RepID=A0ABU1UNW2_9ACTN|nr:hypothetical protein [Aeromicrobium panaciterrae]MDR7086868.1 hypothetical protein [Aeromicrobium panaciterrae]